MILISIIFIRIPQFRKRSLNFQISPQKSGGAIFTHLLSRSRVFPLLPLNKAVKKFAGFDCTCISSANAPNIQRKAFCGDCLPPRDTPKILCAPFRAVFPIFSFDLHSLTPSSPKRTPEALDVYDCRLLQLHDFPGNVPP